MLPRVLPGRLRAYPYLPRPSVPLPATPSSRLLSKRPSGLRLGISLATRPLSTSRPRRRPTSTGSDETGHIQALQNEGIFFFQNLYPLGLGLLLRAPFPSKDVEAYINQRVEQLNIPKDAIGYSSPTSQTSTDESSFKITEVLSRADEGGAYVKFMYGADQDPKELERNIKKNLKSKPIRAWYSFYPVRAALVKGVPWLEDLHRLPTRHLKVEFWPAEAGESVEGLSEESLYSLFRRYGRIVEIKPQPYDSKELPKYAHLHFHRARDAILAKCCLHGLTVSPELGGGKTGTVIKIVYRQKRKFSVFWSWLINHPRISLPLLFAFLGTTAVMVFDPIRTFFIKAHVTRSFHISDYRIIRWFRSQATKSIRYLSLNRRGGDGNNLRAIWDDRQDAIEQVQKWLLETADTFVVIHGPRGSGKKELVLDQALKGRKNVLLVDCKSIQEARGDANTINAAALQVGYRPVFSWMNNINSFVDMAAQGAIGAKTGFSETLDTQLQHIWQQTSYALQKIALGDRSKNDKDASLGDDEYLEAHPEKRPVIVINNFLHKSAENSLVYDRLAEWAANLTTSNIAHVIFLTSDISFSKSLSKALPDRVFRQISLGDCSPEVAKRFVMNYIDATSDPPDTKTKSSTPEEPPSQNRSDLRELDNVISTIGGRLTDLEFLARRIKSGEAPTQAVNEIITQSASEILKVYVLDTASPTEQKGWTPSAAWNIISSLATQNSISYNELVLLKNVPESAIRALEQSELITISSHNGRPSTIKPGKPVFTAAFKRLVEDEVLAARMAIESLGKKVKKTEDEIKEAEEELGRLAELPGGSNETVGRVRWLLGKIGKGQKELEGWEREKGRLEGVVKKL